MKILEIGFGTWGTCSDTVKSPIVSAWPIEFGIRYRDYSNLSTPMPEIANSCPLT